MSRPSGQRSRRAQASPLLLSIQWEGGARIPPDLRKVRRNRRAPGASSGGAFGRDKRSRLERTNVPPAGGDRQIADCSVVTPRHCSIKETICVYLRDLRFSCFDGRPSCLCVFVFAMSCSVFLSVSLCLCGFLGGEISAFEVAGGGENELLRVEVAADGI